MTLPSLGMPTPTAPCPAHPLPSLLVQLAPVLSVPQSHQSSPCGLCVCCLLGLEWGFSAYGGSTRRGHLSLSGDIFGCDKLGLVGKGEGYGHLGGGGQDGCSASSHRK